MPSEKFLPTVCLEILSLSIKSQIKSELASPALESYEQFTVSVVDLNGAALNGFLETGK